jgi:hypothetical protein
LRRAIAVGDSPGASVPSSTATASENSPAITHTRLADRDRADTGHHLTLRQMAVAHNVLADILSLEAISFARRSDLGHYGLS